MPTDKLEDFILDNREAFDDQSPAPKVWSAIEAAIDTDHDDDDDPLESFIVTNREAFDDSTPPPELEAALFAAVDASADTPLAPATAPRPALRLASSRARKLRLIGIAASVLFLIFAAFSLGNQRGYQAAEEAIVASELRQIDPDLPETERYYQREIAAQFNKVTQVNNDPQLRADLEAIDVATEEIRTELLNVPVSQRADLVDRLIETYRTKLDILLRIQQHLPADDSTPSTQQTTDEL